MTGQSDACGCQLLLPQLGCMKVTQNMIAAPQADVFRAQHPLAILKPSFSFCLIGQSDTCGYQLMLLQVDCIQFTQKSAVFFWNDRPSAVSFDLNRY